MWNRSGLPLVFPLILRTAPGEDVFVTLTAVGADAPAMAAYARGGEFFRVLVPPGTYELLFAAGTGWQGEDALFGPGDATRRFGLDDPLTFRVRGLGSKVGHIVDLTDAARGVLAGKDIDVRPTALCRTVRLVPPDDRAGAGPDESGRRYARGDGPISENRQQGAIRDLRDDDGPIGADPFFGWEDRPRPPRHEVRTVLCDSEPT